MDIPIYLSLFAAACLAGSILPMSSEAALLAAWAALPDQTWLLWAIASLGNTAGAWLNWWLGRWLEHFKDRSWFPVSHAQLGRAQLWFQRFGIYTLFLSWVPIIGDPLTVAAGFLRVRLWVFLLITGLVKSGRYFLLLWALS